MKDEKLDFNIKRPRLMARLIKDKSTRLNIRILVLMFLVAVAVYHITSYDICGDINNTKLTNKDKLGLFYKCELLNQTELDIINKQELKTTNFKYNLTLD